MPVDDGMPSLMDDTALPVPPVLSTVTGVPDPAAGVPAGVAGGPTVIVDILASLTGEVEKWRRAINSAGVPGFLVTAADVQRAAEIEPLLADAGRALAAASRILAERA